MIAELGRPHPAFTGSLDSLAKAHGIKRPQANTQHVEVGRGDPGRSRNPGALSPLEAIDAVSKVHGSMVTHGYPLSTPGDLTPKFGMLQTSCMPTERRWTQQEHFRNVALDYMSANGLTEDAFGAILGYSGGTLHQYMYNPVKRPDAFDFLVPFCRETGRAIGEFIDDPAAEGLTETDRFMSRVMGSDLSKLTDAQKQSAVEAWRAIVRGYAPPK